MKEKPLNPLLTGVVNRWVIKFNFLNIKTELYLRACHRNCYGTFLETLKGEGLMAQESSNSYVDEQATAGAHDKVDRAAQRAHDAVNRAATMAGSGEEKLHNLADELRKQAEQLANSAKNRSDEVSSAVSDYTRTNPLKTIGLAFLVGAVVAFLFRK
jgi:ElaB/YqjD/DUF883 family membrane-anchored ribosome-binding protein